MSVMALVYALRHADSFWQAVLLLNHYELTVCIDKLLFS